MPRAAQFGRGRLIAPSATSCASYADSCPAREPTISITVLRDVLPSRESVAHQMWRTFHRAERRTGCRRDYGRMKHPSQREPHWEMVDGDLFVESEHNRHTPPQRKRNLSGSGDERKRAAVMSGNPSGDQTDNEGTDAPRNVEWQGIYMPDEHRPPRRLCQRPKIIGRPQIQFQSGLVGDEYAVSADATTPTVTAGDRPPCSRRFGQYRTTLESRARAPNAWRSLQGCRQSVVREHRTVPSLWVQPSCEFPFECGHSTQ